MSTLITSVGSPINAINLLAYTKYIRTRVLILMQSGRSGSWGPCGPSHSSASSIIPCLVHFCSSLTGSGGFAEYPINHKYPKYPLSYFITKIPKIPLIWLVGSHSAQHQDHGCDICSALQRYCIPKYTCVNIGQIGIVRSCVVSPRSNLQFLIGRPSAGLLADPL